MFSERTSSALRIVAGFLALSTCVHAIPATLEDRQDDNRWVTTWTSMPQLVESSNMPPSPFAGGSTFKDATLRQTLRMTIGADRIRVQISNTFGGSDLPITAASLALPTGGKTGVGGIDAATLAALTFNGKASTTVPRGSVVYSDPINFKIVAQSMLTVSLYSQPGQSGSSITGHPGSRTTSWMQTGNQVNATNVSGASTKHWYFVSAVEAWAPKTTSALIILGDSITDGRGSTDDANNRWPDLLLARMVKAGITNVGIGNQAAGGNAVLTGGLGPTLQSRYKRDALTMQGVKYVLIFEGVNDIGGGGTDSGSQTRIGDGLINAYKQIARDCKAAGIKVYGATITPFGGSGQSYSNPTREATRQKVNQWIINNGGTFDGVVDFSKMIGTGDHLQSAYDGGDHLHPNVAGYQAMADGFPLDLLKA